MPKSAHRDSARIGTVSASEIQNRRRKSATICAWCECASWPARRGAPAARHQRARHFSTLHHRFMLHTIRSTRLLVVSIVVLVGVAIHHVHRLPSYIRVRPCFAEDRAGSMAQHLRAIAKNAGGGAARIAALDREVRAAHRYTLCRLPLVDRVFADHSGAGRSRPRRSCERGDLLRCVAPSVTHKYAGLIQTGTDAWCYYLHRP